MILIKNVQFIIDRTNQVVKEGLRIKSLEQDLDNVSIEFFNLSNEFGVTPEELLIIIKELNMKKVDLYSLNEELEEKILNDTDYNEEENEKLKAEIDIYHKEIEEIKSNLINNIFEYEGSDY